MLFITHSYLLEEQFSFCSSLEHWDMADHNGCLGSPGARGEVVMLALQLQ